MKKIILLILLFLPIKVNAISASAYIVMDTDNERVLEGHNLNAPYLIASTTKIMTALVVLNNYDINTNVKIGPEVLKSYGSGIYVEVGETISVHNLLYGLMLRSGNDAAMALAREVGGSMEGFVSMMNETALSIGMKNTKFLNSHGLEENNKEGNTSTVYDMGLLSSYSIKNDIYKEIAGTKSKLVKTDYKTYSWTNKNKLLKSYKYCTGGKTGFTDLAKRTLVTTASKDNINLTVVTFRDGNDFKNHHYLYEKYFDELKSYKILKKGFIETKNKNTYIKEDVYISLSKSELKKVKTEVNFYKGNVTNVKGEIDISLNGKSIKKVPLYIKEEVKEEKLSFFTWLIRKLGFSG